MKTDIITPCRTMTDLQSCLEADTHCVPTVEFTVRNFELPLNQADLNFLDANEINLFAARQVEERSTTLVQPYASSRNLTDQTLTFDVPFILLGICVYAYGDPVASIVEGNQFYPQQALQDFNQLPASPMNPRQANNGALFGAGGAPQTFEELCPAQIEWGSPTWRAVWAFLHSYRLEMRCPSSSYDLLMDEALSDIGNCCSQVEWGGYGTSKMSHIRNTRNINDRLQINRTTMPGGADPGFFVPINSELSVTPDVEITPQRYVGEEAAYGRPISMPAVEQWFRLPCPIPFPSIPQPKLKITLKKANGDEGYLARMIQEMAMDPCLNPVPGLGSGMFPTLENGAPLQTNGYGMMTRIPGGQMRIGIGLKGFEVRASVCEDLMGMLEGKTFAELKANPQTRFLTEGGGQVMQGQYGGPSVCVPFGLGQPDGGEQR